MKQSTSNKATPLYVLPKQIETEKNKKNMEKMAKKTENDIYKTKENDYRYRFGKRNTV